MTTEDSLMPGRRPGMPGWALVAAAWLLAGCASPSLVPKQQAAAIEKRDLALASHADAIQAAIRESGKIGALVFRDAAGGPPVVLPGDTPDDAWTQHRASVDTGTAPASVPAVLTFVYRADVPKAPDTVTVSALRQHQALRASLTALETDLRETIRRTEERLGSAQQELSASIAAAHLQNEQALAAAKADVQKALATLADDLKEARRYMLQVAELGWLNREMNTETASGLRKVATASQELTASSAKLADTLRQLSVTLASQLKDLATRLDALQEKISNVK